MLTIIRLVAAVALMAYSGALAFILFVPSGAVPSGLVHDAMLLATRMDVPAKLVDRSRVEFGLNVLAFAPITLLGSLLRPSIRVTTWTAAAFAVSLLVEGAQTIVPERMAAHSDVVANTSGAAAGAIVAWILVRPLRHRR